MTLIHEGFPANLLLLPYRVRLAYFEQIVIAHPKLTETLNKVIQAIHSTNSARLIQIVGPTGVGKSTLRQLIEKYLVEQTLSDLETDPGCFPFVTVEAVAPESGSFDWDEFNRRVLVALDEPLIDEKIDYAEYDNRTKRIGNRGASRRKVVLNLHWALLQCLRYRRPHVLIVDEGQYTAKAADAHQLNEQAEKMFSFVEATKVLLLMLGTYELLAFKNVTTRLDECSVDIHFPRYRFDMNEDRQAFQRVLLTFQRHLPLPNEPDLVSDAEYFYERSTGCVGVLKDWFHRALAETIEDGQPMLTRAHLDRHAMSADKLLRMAREIKEGEEKFRQLNQPTAAVCSDTQSARIRKVKSGASVSRSKRQKVRVGERRPTRDKVGR